MEQRLKRRVVDQVVPSIAASLLRTRGKRPGEARLEGLRIEALTLLYRGLFRLYVQARGLRRVTKRDAITRQLACVDYGVLPIRVLGSIHEMLLEYRLKLSTSGKPYLICDRSKRRATGSYYTPERIVRHIVEHTLAGTPLHAVKVLDPAMGCGHFLVEAAHFIAGRMGHDGSAGVLKRHVLTHCVHGVDLDPLAVMLAKMSLWLDAGCADLPLSAFDANLRIGDTLLDATVVPASGEYDAVIGNPPYSGHKGDFDAAPLRERFAVCRDYANPATAFCELATRVIRPGGRFGLVIPKSIQYVQGWAAARKLLTREHRLERLDDASEAFGDVLLEQTVVIGRRSPPVDAYEGGVLDATGAVPSQRIPLAVCDSLGSLPAALDPRSLSLFAHIARLGLKLDDVSQTSQALAYQARINLPVAGHAATGRIPIHRGRQVRPMRLEPPTDWIDRAHLLAAGNGHYTAKVSAMLGPKVVTQNIVAHVTRPRPRVRIISAPDPIGVVCLNTISTTVMTDARFPVAYVAAVLNSTLASWFYSEMVFCRAVRTMHFDGYYAGKLPLALPTAEIVDDAQTLPRTCADAGSRTRVQQLIDDVVFRAYEVTDAQRSFLYEYCYGTDELCDGVLDGRARFG